MTHDEIIAIARQADIWTEKDFMFADVLNPKVEAFAKLVAAHERELCAKMCDELYAEDETVSIGECVNAIRARGQQ